MPRGRIAAIVGPVLLKILSALLFLHLADFSKPATGGSKTESVHEEGLAWGARFHFWPQRDCFEPLAFLILCSICEYIKRLAKFIDNLWHRFSDSLRGHWKLEYPCSGRIEDRISDYGAHADDCRLPAPL
jgi:hypothetical protein